MSIRERSPAAFVMAILLAACGSSAPTGFDDDGGSAGADDNGGAGRGGGGGGPGATGGGGAGGGGSSRGLISGDAGRDAAAETCSTPGATRPCCTTGAQTCTQQGEFLAWGPCQDSAGKPLLCSNQCMPGAQEGRGCDAGPDAPPPAPPPPPPPAACTDPTLNTEPGILVGFSPAPGATVSQTGQIKVWVSDENPPFISPGEVVDNTTGAITKPGNRTAVASDGYLYEPALYIAPDSPTNGGTPHFPQWVKGSYNNNPPTRGTFTGGAPIDPIPSASAVDAGLLGALLSLASPYTGEFIWDVSALGLAPGTYTAVFSVHDGDQDRAIGCVVIVVTS